MRMLNFREIFNCAFKIYSIWPQASKSIHTHSHNAVTLVGLAQACPNYAPINFLRCKFSCKYLMKYEHGFVAMTTVMPHNSVNENNLLSWQLVNSSWLM